MTSLRSLFLSSSVSRWPFFLARRLPCLVVSRIVHSPAATNRFRLLLLHSNDLLIKKTCAMTIHMFTAISTSTTQTVPQQHNILLRRAVVVHSFVVDHYPKLSHVFGRRRSRFISKSSYQLELVVYVELSSMQMIM
jgi:hypothetical protein